MDDNKYVVFKADDVLNFANEIVETLKSQGAVRVHDAEQAAKAFRVDDAVVIRQQDVFAAPALDAYANAITTATATIRSAGGMNSETYGMVRRLEGIADYFHRAAKESWDTVRKVPD